MYWYADHHCHDQYFYCRDQMLIGQFFSDPVGFPIVSKTGCIIFFASLSSRSIHMSWSWILFLISFRRVIFGFTSKKNPIECSLCELNVLCDKKYRRCLTCNIWTRAWVLLTVSRIQSCRIHILSNCYYFPYGCP